jgi:hypothetical protein
MPKVSPIQNNFNAGEFSPLLKGRTDADRYRAAVDTALNYLTLLQGPLDRRTGTYFVAEVKNSAKATRLERFKFSTTQAYIIEVGDLYMRFYKDHGQIQDGGSAYEIATPYLEADLFRLKFNQSADTIYITHPSYAPRKLTRTGHTSWTLSTISFLDGPYLPVNATSKTLRATATTGSAVQLVQGPTGVLITGAANNGSGLIRITAAAHGLTTGDRVVLNGITGTTEANNIWTVTVITSGTFDLQGSTFVNAYAAGGTIYPGLIETSDVGRSVRMLVGGTWGWGRIVTANHVALLYEISIVSAMGGTTATTSWRLGAWSERTGYPGCSTFHEDRLAFGGTSNYPLRRDLSKSGDYENFEPTATNGTVADDNAVSFSQNSNDVNASRWIISDEKGLLDGTTGGEWVIRPSSQGEAISPTNVAAKPTTNWGSADVQPVQVGKATLFVTASGKKLREMTHFYDVDGFRCPDLTELAEHIAGTGIKQIAYTKEPQPFVWCVRNDGAVAVVAYEREMDNLRVGWSRHILGGTSDAAGTQAIVESVAAIPAPNPAEGEEPWFIVKRWINGSTKRYIEYKTKRFDDDTEQKDAFFVDCGLTYDAPKTITGITKANPGVVTSVAHGLSNGDSVRITEVEGMTEVNDVTFTVANKTADNFQLSGVNTTAYTTYISGGVVRKLVSTVSGLSHLNGQVVQVLGDGAVQTDQTVSAGAITLDTPSGTVQVGLGYNSDVKLLPIEAGAADGTASGKTRRTHRVGIRLHRSLGLKLGMSFDKLDTIIFRTAADDISRAVPLFTGIKSKNVAANYDFDNQICIRQDQPLPSMILAVMPQMVTQDRG